MDFATKGNEKIGKAVIVNRAVGDSCPQDCYFLNNGCYAQFTELRFPAARELGLRNLTTDKHSIVRAIDYAIKNTNGKIRIHERGDFAKDNKLDSDYLKAWVTAIKETGIESGIWVYTHMYDSKILILQNYGVAVYASVHNREQLRRAKKAGFKLFAYITKQKKKRGGSHDVPKYLEFDGKRFLVCPEQRMGRLKVTCCGSEKGGVKTTACNWCVLGKGNVTFLEH